MEYKNASILLVDDDQVDVLAVKTALEENNIGNPVYVASNGIEAIQMLRGANNCLKVPTPYLILLDLNMPKMNGLEFLNELRKDPIHRSAIVFVLTTSSDDRDKIAAYDFNVAGYILKSDVGEDFINLIGLLKEYKIIVQFPVRP